MATRVISTKIAVEGESSYRQSISRINGEIKALRSNLALATSKFQENANSMGALEEKGKALEKLYQAQKEKVQELEAALENARAAEERYRREKEQLSAKIQANNRELEKLKSTTGDTAEKEKELTEENKKLNSQLDVCDGKLTAAQRGTAAWENQLNNAKIQLYDTSAQIKLNSQYLGEAKNSADGCATSIDQFGNRLEGTSKSAQALTQALGTAGVLTALKKTADMMASCGKSSIDFESSMAGVAKTTDLTQQELEDMGTAIQDLSHRIPTSATEIAAVVESAGQLGIEKENLLDFAEVMVKLGTATNLNSDEAASSLAKLANITKMAPADYGRLGSTIVDLGNNFATTERDIVSMATRLASAGSIVGLTEPQIMAISTALSSVGIEAEAGGGSISKLLKEFDVMVATGSESLTEYAAIAGMTAEQFKTAWGRDAVGALSSFIDGLGAINDSGGSVAAVLAQLGITEVRMSNAVAALASSDGILSKALATANTAWSANTALNKEADTRYATTESKLQMLQNKADTLKTTFGDQLKPMIDGFSETGGTVLDWATDMIDKSGNLAPLLVSCAGGMGLFVAAVGGYNLIGTAANALLSGLTAAATAHPIFLTAAAVTALAGGIALFISSTKDDDPAKRISDFTQAAQALPEAFETLDQAYQDTEGQINSKANIVDGYIARLKTLESQGKLTDEQMSEYNLILQKISTHIPGLNIQLDQQTGLLEGGADALRDQVQEWKNLAIQQAIQERFTQQLKAYSDAQEELDENRSKQKQALESYNELQQKAADVARTMAEAEKQKNAIDKDSAGNILNPDDIDRWNYWNDQLARANDEDYKLREQMGSTKRELDILNAAVSIGEQTLADCEQTINDTSESLRRLTEESTKAEEPTAGAAGAQMVTDITQRIKDLATAYADSYNAAYESINGQIGLFDEFKVATEEQAITAEQMVQRMQAQADNLNAYTENLKKAREYGLGMGIINQLSDGTAQSAQYLATIVAEIENAGGTASGLTAAAEGLINGLNSAYASTQNAKNSYAQAVAEMQTGFTDALGQLQQDADSAGFTGFAQAMTAALENAGLDMGKIGTDAAAALAKGMEDGKPEIETASGNAAQAAVDAAAELPEKMESLGTDSVKGMIRGIKNMAAELAESMRSAVGGAFTAAQEESEVHSPSKRSERMFEFIGDGMIIGLENKRRPLKETVKDIINDAMDMESIYRAPELTAAMDIRMPEVLPMGAMTDVAGAGQKTVNVSINIDRFENNSDRDLDEICEYIEDRVQINYLKKEAAI